MEQPARLPLIAPTVPRENGVRLDAFTSLLLRWNQRINLVGQADQAAIAARHIDDSLQLLPLIPSGTGPIADLGSGGGFPGFVLALMLDRPVHLVEADRRKAAFLQAAAAELRLAHVTVHVARIEDVSLPPLAVTTARALAPLSMLLDYASRLLAHDGVGLFPKGRDASAELTAAAVSWTFHVERFISRTDPNATILRLSGIRRAGT